MYEGKREGAEKEVEVNEKSPNKLSYNLYTVSVDEKTNTSSYYFVLFISIL